MLSKTLFNTFTKQSAFLPISQRTFTALNKDAKVKADPVSTHPANKEKEGSDKPKRILVTGAAG